MPTAATTCSSYDGNSLKLKMILEKSLSLTMSEAQGASYVSSARYAPGAARARHLTCAGVFVLQFMYICNVFFYFIKKILTRLEVLFHREDEYQRSGRYCAVKQFQSIVINKYPERKCCVGNLPTKNMDSINGESLASGSKNSWYLAKFQLVIYVQQRTSLGDLSLRQPFWSLGAVLARVIHAQWKKTNPGEVLGRRRKTLKYIC